MYKLSVYNEENKLVVEETDSSNLEIEKLFEEYHNTIDEGYHRVEMTQGESLLMKSIFTVRH